MSKNISPIVPEPVSIQMLGGLRIQAGNRVVTDAVSHSPKLWSVLCYLIIQRRPISRDELINIFWAADDRANPASALRTLLHRVRTALAPLFDEELPPIVFQNGCYSWNETIPCRVDTELFEQLYLRAEQPDLSTQQKTDLLLECLALYQGDFLPRFTDYPWVSVLNARYHNLYLSAVKTCAALLQEAGDYERMHEICSRASEFDLLDEELHIWVIRSLLLQKKHSAAQKYYERASDALYRDLGVRPSDELRALYTQIMSQEETVETDLSIVQETLRELHIGHGAFVCEYGVFKEIYRLEARRISRSGGCLHIGLITVSKPDGAAPPLKTLNRTMEQLLEVTVRSLRQGDVVAKYSSAQFVIMLPYANLEDSHMVMGRIVNAFYRHHHRNNLKITYTLRELELPQFIN